MAQTECWCWACAGGEWCCTELCAAHLGRTCWGLLCRWLLAAGSRVGSEQVQLECQGVVHGHWHCWQGLQGIAAVGLPWLPPRHCSEGKASDQDLQSFHNLMLQLALRTLAEAPRHHCTETSRAGQVCRPWAHCAQINS